jgi:hypothetical protein
LLKIQIKTLFSKWIGSANNEDLQSEWRAAKKANKMNVFSLIREKTEYIVNPEYIVILALVISYMLQQSLSRQYY